MIQILFDAIKEKALSSALDHLDCEARVDQAMTDLYLVLTNDEIRRRWLEELKG